MLTGPDDGCGSRPVTWRLADSRGEKQVELVTSGADVRLSIGLGDDEEPAFTGALADLLMVSMGRPWRFVRPGITRAEVAGHDGVLTVTCSVGGLDVNLSLRFDGDFLLVDVTWRNSGEVRLVDVAVGLVLDLPERADERITIPGVVYNDNPSADPSREVPRIGPAPGGGYVCEEHRLPIPAVNVEWVDGAGSRFLNVHSRPAYVDAADGTVHYGSLGVHRTTGGPSVAALSGVVMCGGRPDITYVHKGTTAGYDAGYLDFPPGFVLTKGYALDWGTVGKRGQGFRALVNRRLPWWETAASPPLDLDQMIRLKTQAMDARWAVDGSLAGWLKFPSWGEPASSRPVARDFLYGWTGQCLRLAWCDAQVGFDESTPERVARGRRAVDCYVAGSGTAVPGLRLNACAVDEKRWYGFVRDGHEFVSSRAYGETLRDIADIVALFRSHGAEVPPAWTTTLTDAADFLVDATLPDGIPPLGWRLDGTPHAGLRCAAGLPVVSALVRTYRTTGEQRYLRDAEKMMDGYDALHGETFERPFAHSTLDAACEDKEGGIGYFLAAYDLWQETGRDVHNSRAELAADWLLTFVYVWAPVFDRGSPLRERGFSAVGWPTVSVQNHHLDVFFPAYELMRLGTLTGVRRYVEAAEAFMAATAQGISTGAGDWDFSVVGEQGEAFFQTNWQSRGRSNTWNPSWVIALPLSNALRIRAGA